MILRIRQNDGTQSIPICGAIATHFRYLEFARQNHFRAHTGDEMSKPLTTFAVAMLLIASSLVADDDPRSTKSGVESVERVRFVLRESLKLPGPDLDLLEARRKKLQDRLERENSELRFVWTKVSPPSGIRQGAPQIEFTRDGKHLLSASTLYTSHANAWPNGGTVTYWSVEGGEQDKIVLVGKQVNTIAMSGRGNKIAMAIARADFTREIVVGSVKRKDAEPTALLDELSAVHTLTLSPNGKRLAFVGDGNTLYMHSTKTGELIRSTRVFGETVRVIKFSPYGKLVAIPSYIPTTPRDRQLGHA